MYTTINEWDFVDAFKKSDTYKNNFSHDGLKALFDYLEQFEEDCGERIEFDMIALCCEYSEYKTAWEAMEQYQPEDMPTVENSEGMDLIEIQEASEKLALEWLEERTQVITFDGGIIIADF